jgi:hypothetical protein
MGKDRFGYGTIEPPVIKHDPDMHITDELFKGLQIPSDLLPAAKEISKDFGDSFGNDLSLMILMHYENTGQLLKEKDINSKRIKELKEQYNIFKTNDPGYQRHMGLDWDKVNG